MKLKRVGEELYPIYWHWEECGDIPFLVVEPKMHGKPAILYYYHGWSSSPESQLLRMQIFASHGMKVIAPTALHHGRRGIIDYKNMDLVKAFFWESMKQNILEFETVHHFVMEEVPQNRGIYLYGNSMGAMSAAKIYSKREDILACALTNGTWHYGALEDYFQKTYYGKGNGPDIQAPKEEDFKTKPLYVLGGDEDKVVPQQSMCETIEAMNVKGYPAKYMNYMGLGHYVTANMLGEIVNFYQEQDRE